MATSNPQEGSLAQYELDLIWGAWVEIGVSGWQRTHRSWTVDPEPLIIRTAAISDSDPRLRDESLDWCIHYWRYVSRVRLRNLLRDESDDFDDDSWGEFAATANAYSNARWPAATDDIAYAITGRSSLESMEQASRAWLRLRAMFGLGARTEILRFFLSGRRRATVARIAERIGYAKRNVADECDSLERAGILRMRPVGNRFFYSLARADDLDNFVGPIGPITPDWTALFRVTSAFVRLEEVAKKMPVAALMVESHRIARLIDDDLDILGVDDRPDLVQPDNYWPAVRDFARTHMSAWAAGQWTPDDKVRKLTVRQRGVKATE